VYHARRVRFLGRSHCRQCLYLCSGLVALATAHCVRATGPFLQIVATPYGPLSGDCSGPATAARKQGSAPTAPSKCRGQSAGSTSFFATRRSIRRRVQWVRVGDALVNPASTVVTSPDMAPEELARHRAARDVNRPPVPKLSSSRLSAVIVVYRGADHTIYSSCWVEAAPRGGGPRRMASSPSVKCTCDRDAAYRCLRVWCNETLALRLMRSKKVKPDRRLSS
jgi:hypothetical protein